MNPRPTEKAVVEYYAEDSYQPFLSAQSSRTIIDWVYVLIRKYTLASKRRKIERLKSPGRLLDIGCGTGE
ncbi:class I SAM-dependent methyltransferase, partial [bacterium]|nr:class I SAM-dependent methyltransferase [bacterium]